MSDMEQAVADLIAYPTELPWLEFKENWFEPHALGEYIPVLSKSRKETYGRECYKFQDNAIVVTIPFHRIDEVFVDDEATNKVSNKVSNKPGYKVRDKSYNLNPPRNKTQSNVLDIIRDNSNVTRPQLMEALSLGETSIQNAIAHLRKNGYIGRVGSSKTGWWRVLK